MKHATRHTFFEDAQAILTAAAFVSLGLAFLRSHHLLTGGTAGLALLLARLVPLSFGQLFALLNLPFFWLGVKQLGWRFTLKTFSAIFLVSLASDHMGEVLHFEHVSPVYAAAMGGFLNGAGLLMLFRHRASLGGVNILSIWLQEKHGLRAGLVQLAVDACVVVGGLLVTSPGVVALSVLGALALNMVLAVNHRPGRYVATG
ncbi:MAG: YitT family protein [Anaeromyxobacteraceae bacterium]